MPATPSHSHLVLIPSYNTGDIVLKTVKQALEYWSPVWVVVDGSDDGSGEKLDALAKLEKNLRVFRLARNQGKGEALLHGFDEAEAHGFTHILCMDADGQHPADMIPEYMTLSMAMPDRMILGKPIFDGTAPRIRVNGRKLSNLWVHIETLSYSICDSLFGMRVYPVGDLVRIMEKIRWARRYDFDAEIAVRLSWRGVRALNLPTPVKYLTVEEGGVSHFRYLRDNVLITWMHFRLIFFSWWLKIPMLLLRKKRVNRAEQLENPGSKKSLDLLGKRIVKHYPSRWYQGYVRKKFQTDPAYDVVFEILAQGQDMPLLDVGCGIGLLEFYLRERGMDIPIVAIDQDLKKVKVGHRIASQHYQNLRFEMGHAESLLPDFQGNVCLLDVLQYCDEQDQRSILRKTARAVAPGGLLIIRSGMKDASRRSKVSKCIDCIACLTSWMKFSSHEFPPQDFVSEILKCEGLQRESRPLWGNTPFNNYLLSYRRPQRKDSGGGKTQR